VQGLVVVTLIAVSGLSVKLWMKRASAQTEEGSVVAVQRGTVKVAIEEVGSVEPLRKVDLKSKVAGQVRDVLVDVGSRVKAGDVLVRLDPRDAQRELALAFSRHAVTQAALTQAEQVLAIQERAKHEGGASSLDVVRAESEAKRLRAQLNVERVEQAVLQDHVGYMDLKAPIDGVVLARNINAGEMVTPGVASMVDGKPLLVVAQVDKLLVRVELNQLDVVRLSLGDKVSVRVDALPERSFVGTVHRTAAMAQRTERRHDSTLMIFPVDVVVDTAQDGAAALRPGMMSDVVIDLKAHENVLYVPLEALVREGGKTQLRKVIDGPMKEALVDVIVGLQNDKQVEILAGIEEGARIRVRSSH
jgi:RND family efflux transporter MFP subunit